MFREKNVLRDRNLVLLVKYKIWMADIKLRTLIMRLFWCQVDDKLKSNEPRVYGTRNGIYLMSQPFKYHFKWLVHYLRCSYVYFY